MDQKAWLWRKRSSEKTILINEKSDIHTEAVVDELQSLPIEKEVALEKSMNILNEKLASLLSECNVKDELLATCEKKAQEAIEGKEKADKELQFLRKRLDEALQQKLEANERISSLNSALKDCMQQLSFNKNEQAQRVHEAAMRTSKELEKAHKKLEENLSEMGKKVTTLMVENTHLTEALMVKENLIKDMGNRKAQVEAEFAALMSRLDFVEKENAFLRYELRMLEKDLDIRNEEIEFSRHSAESLQRQQQENVKKIKKLEAECQRLRVLARKRLPGPGALVSMKTEVELQGIHQIEMRRRKLNPVSGGLVIRESRSAREDLDLSNKRISFLVEHLQNVEKENKILRDILCNKDNASCYSITEFTQKRPKIPQEEPLPGDLHTSQEPVEQAVSNSVLSELSSISGSNVYEENTTNSSRSSASVLVSQLDNFKDAESNNPASHSKMGISDMNLMDDFVEMEKLAIVAVDVPHGDSYASSGIDQARPESLNKFLTDLDPTGKELVPVGKDHLGVIDQEPLISNSSFKEYCDWLQNILEVINKQVQVSERTADEILEDIKVGLCSEASAATSQLQPISGYITWKSPAPSPRANSFHQAPVIDSSVEEKRNQSIHSINQCISDIIELVKRFGSINSHNCSLPTSRSEQKLEDYIIHVFGWKSSDLISVLQQFIDTCNYFLDGQVDLEKFATELSSAMGWISRNCITTNHEIMDRYNLKHHFGSCGPGSRTELESMQNILFDMRKVHCAFEIENEGLKAKVKQLKTLQHELELSIKSARENSKALSKELQQSHESIISLQTEVENLRVSKQIIEDQFENQKLISEDIDTQLNLTKSRLNDISQKFSSLEVELEHKNHHCQELEGACLELQLQLESIASKENLKDNTNQEGKLLQTGWEIKAASAKLAECEAAILNLGDQLKGLTPSNGPSCGNNVLFTHKKSTKLARRFSLLDRMLSEDDEKAEAKKTPMTRGNSSTTGVSTNALSSSSGQLEPKGEDGKGATAGTLVVIPGKKRRGGFSFLRKLLITRNQSSRKKTSLSFAV